MSEQNARENVQDQVQETVQNLAAETRQGMSDADAALLKEVMAQKEKIRAYEAAEAKRQADAQAAEAKKLEEEGKYKELLAKMQSDLETANTKRKKAEIRVAAIAAGIDPRFARLIDTSGIAYSDDGTMIGLDVAIDAVVKEFPEARSSDQPTRLPGVSSPGTPSKAVSVASYDDYLKLSPQQKADFYKKNPAAYRQLADAAMKKR